MTATEVKPVNPDFSESYYPLSGNDLLKSRIYDYGFRDYSPVMQRFTTVDPIHAGTNWYSYVDNDPINFIDPFGLEMSLVVDKDTQTMTVTVNNYREKTRVINITTAVVSHDSEPNEDTSRTVTRNGNTTNPTQFPNGTHNVTVSDDNPTGDDGFGETWLVTDATQTLTDVDTGEDVEAGGYDIHLTPYSNTNGCVGVISEKDMKWLAEQFEENEIIDPGSTTITVSGGSEPELKNK